MATERIEDFGNHPGSALAERPNLYFVPNAEATPHEAELSPGQKIDRYFDLREAAKAEVVPEAQVGRIQDSVRIWLAPQLTPDSLAYEYYADGQAYNEATITRFNQLITHLHAFEGHVIPQSVFDASKAFIEMVTSVRDARPDGDAIAKDADGSFGFIVPARASRNRPEDSAEAIDPCPILRYVPDELRVAMYAGLPPFIVDRFKVDEHGRRGYMILAPVYPDMMKDIKPASRAMRIAREAVNDAVRLGRNAFGIRTFGLGASLPAVTHYGESITVPDVVTTTGHGGTIALILETMHALQERKAVNPEAAQKIGILGVGTIGESIARVIAQEFPGADIRVFDPNEDRLGRAVTAISAVRKLADGTGSIMRAETMREVLTESGIVISAVTGDVNLKKELGDKQLKGLVIIDDSQPWVFRKNEVEERGGHIVWVAGEDARGRVATRDSSWGYGGTLRDNGEFGCALEVATVNLAMTRVMQEVEATLAGNPRLLRHIESVFSEEAGQPVKVDPHEFAVQVAVQKGRELALRRAVQPEDASRFIGMFNAAGITVASFQAEGQPTDFANVSKIPGASEATQNVEAAEEAKLEASGVIPITRHPRHRWHLPHAVAALAIRTFSSH